MCKKSDIILVDHYISQGCPIGKHPFVVIEDQGGEITGCSFDMICNVMSSFKSAEQKAKKLSYPGNFEITAIEQNVPGGNSLDGYIKADQLYFFKKDKLSYRIIGSVDPLTFNELIDFINSGNFPIEAITENL